jgi:hypothetical protein
MKILLTLACLLCTSALCQLPYNPPSKSTPPFQMPDGSINLMVGCAGYVYNGQTMNDCWDCYNYWKDQSALLDGKWDQYFNYQGADGCNICSLLPLPNPTINEYYNENANIVNSDYKTPNNILRWYGQECFDESNMVWTTAPKTFWKNCTALGKGNTNAPGYTPGECPLEIPAPTGDTDGVATAAIVQADIQLTDSFAVATHGFTFANAFGKRAFLMNGGWTNPETGEKYGPCAQWDLYLDGNEIIIADL